MNKEYLDLFASAFEGSPEMETAFDNYEELRMLRSEPELLEPIIKLDFHRATIHVSARVDSFCKLECGKGLTIGKMVHIASFSHIGLGGGKVVIEDYVGISSGTIIISGSNVCDDVPSMSAVAPFHMRKFNKDYTTTLKRFSGTYAGAVIFPGVTLHEGAIAAAGAIVTQDIPAWEIWAGNPAHCIRLRKRPPAREAR